MEHQEITLSCINLASSELDPGGKLTLVLAACSKTNILPDRLMVRVVDGADIVLAESSLAMSEDATSLALYFRGLLENNASVALGRIDLTVPLLPGPQEWTAVLSSPAEDGSKIIHASASVPFIVGPHSLGLAVWNIPSPVIVEEDFKVTVGAKSSTGCSLAGKVVSIHDHEGNLVRNFELGDSVYSEKVDLYWKDVVLSAPSVKGDYVWQASLAGTGLELPHGDGRCSIALVVYDKPDCRLKVVVKNKQDGTPIPDAWVVLRPSLHQAYTDADGIAVLDIARGSYELSVSASVLAPKGLPYKIGEVPRLTRGFENLVYVPEENCETFQPYCNPLELIADQMVIVELLGVVEPPEEDTL